MKGALWFLLSVYEQGPALAYSLGAAVDQQYEPIRSTLARALFPSTFTCMEHNFLVVHMPYILESAKY